MSQRTVRQTLLAIAALFWLATGAALSTRTYFVFNYDSLASLPPHLEVIGAALPVLSVFICLIACVALVFWSQPQSDKDKAQVKNADLRVILFLSLASFPLAILIARSIGSANPMQPQQTYWWEPIVFSVFSGLAWSIPIGRILGNPNAQISEPATPSSKPTAHRFVHLHLPLLLLTCSAIACTIWWSWQSVSYYNDFQLGFNDFGHFLLRVANTARFNGFLKETDILPPFWDHFNPGLILLVPLWWVAPDPRWIFVLQASSLALSSLVIYAIARQHRTPRWSAMMWGLAWLSYPSIGQMNLAYTYGWHPITFAIPSLLGAYYFLIAKRALWASALTLLACSFEEGAVAAIGCYAAAEALRCLWKSRLNGTEREGPNEGALGSAKSWGTIWLLATISFVLIYKFSGLAEFQTGRFARLGDGASDILLSPLLRTNVWLELLFRERNGAFVSFLFAPFILTCISILPRHLNLQRRNFSWTILATVPLFMVLLLWEHLPAQSLAFQYASVIIPILFTGAIRTSTDSEFTSARTSSNTWITGFVLSCFVGQFPWTAETLMDVKSRSYGPLSFSNDGYTPESKTTRRRGAEDNLVFHDQLQKLREQGIQREVSSESLSFHQIRILATGRLASHLLGCKDLETVGQFWQRRADYQKLRPDLASPLLRFDAIAIDPIEAFQQTPEETARVRGEAIQLGFSIERIPNGFELWVAPE